MKSNLMMMAAIAAVGMTIVSCSSDNETLVENVKPGKAHARMMCFAPPAYFTTRSTIVPSWR